MMFLKLFGKIIPLLGFTLFYFQEIVISGFRIAWDVLTAKKYRTPGFIEIPLDTENEVEIAVIASLITFSPGSMVVGLSDDRRLMRVHIMFLQNEQEEIASIKDNLERRVLEVMR